MSDCAEKRLLIACGGTGGHLFPGIAVAEAWTRRGGEVLLLISEKQIDALASEGYDHLRFERMHSRAMPGLLSPRMPGFLFGVARSTAWCRGLLKSFGADAVLGMGGFTSTAPLVAGRLRGLPTFIHESNAVPGRANRLNARFSRTVLVGFERCAPAFGAGRNVEVVGTPLRPSLSNRASRTEAVEVFGLRPDRTTLMVMGGSQGARRLNELVAASLPELGRAGVQVLHISGFADYETLRPVYEANPEAGVLREFCAEMKYAYAAADLVVCRSGASTLTEVAFFEIPAVLVPYPYAADDHQARNAEIFSRPGAAQLWPQSELNEENFAGKILGLVNAPDELRKMKEIMGQLAIPDASDRICDVVLDHLS